MAWTYIDPADIVNIVNEYNAFIDEVGFDAKITVGLNLDAEADPGEYVVGALWPKGTMETKFPAVRATGKTFNETLQCLKDGWEEAKSLYRQQRIRTMAMLIMNMTEVNGSCSEQDLIKTGQFNEREVKEYGIYAVSDANMLTTKGPFKLVESAKT